MAPTCMLVVLLEFAAVWSIIAQNQVYVTPDNGHSCPSGSTCHNLSYYISQPDTYFTSNTTIIFISGEHQLNKQEPVMVVGADNLTLEGRGDWIEGPEENVMLSTAIIRCTSGNGGFAFIKSVSITIRGLTFLTCGTTIYKNALPLYAVIFVRNLFQFEFHQNSVQGSKFGFQLLVTNCNKVQVTNSSFFHTNHSQYLNPSTAAINCTYGGSSTAMFTTISQLEVSDSNFTKSCSENTCKQCLGPVTSIQVDNATLTRLTLFKFEAMFAGIYAVQPTVLTITKSTFKQGKGTGIFISAEKSTGYFLTIQETHLINNGLGHSAEDALIDVHCNPNPQQKINIVQLLSLQIVQTVKTKLLTDGLGIMIDGCQYIVIENLVAKLQYLNTGLMINTRFYPQSGKTEQTYFDIRNSSFMRNGHMQSVLLLRNVKGRIINSNFSNNFNGLSVVTLTTSVVTFTNCSISNNHNVTGLTVINQGGALFEGLNIIQNNSASQGAGIKLLATSRIRVIGILRIYDNIANKGVGGGMYDLLSNKLQLPLMPSNTDNNLCSILIDSRGSIDFSGNRAVKGGSDTYGLKLTDCYVIKYTDLTEETRYDEYIPTVRTGNIYFNTPLVKYFHFNDTDPLSSMSSDPIIVCFCDETNRLPNCSERTHHTRTYPGMEINTMIATVGYYGGTSPGTVQVNVLNATLVRIYGQKETKECFPLHIFIANPNPTTALVDIGVNGGLGNLTVSIEVDILECPIGFSKDQDLGQCKCVSLLADNNVKCNLSLQPFKFLRSGNSWFAYINDSHTQCITGVNNCPFDYCNQSNVSFDIATPDRQCVGDRTGILCGKCHSGLSLMLGSNRCASCSKYYLLLLPVFALAGIVLVAILMFLNLTVSVGTINGLLFYANMIKLNEAFFFSSGSVPVVSQFISWLNLDLGIEVCLFDGLDGYWKTWLQFAFPLYLFLLMTGIIIGSHYSVRICKLCGSHAVPALATLFLMSYTKILRTVTNALSMSRLTCGDSTLTVWSVDGNIAYGNGKHIPLVVFSCGVLVIGLAYPVLVLCAPLLEKYSHKCIPNRWNPVQSLKPLLDAYGGPYKDRYCFRTGVTLLLRLVVTIVFSFTSGEVAKINTSIISTAILGIFLSWIFMSAVYRNVYLSVLEVAFLTNLFLLCNVSNAASLLKLQILQKESTIISVALSITCFTIIVIVRCGQKMCNKYMKCCAHKQTSQLLNLSQLAAADDDDGERERVPGSPPDQVYDSEKGQHRSLLEFRHSPAGGDTNTPSPPEPMETEPLFFED